MTNAVALDSVGMQLSKMLGPALAGALIALVDVAGGYVAVSLFYLVAVILMWSMKLPSRRSTGRGSESILRNLAEGFSYVRSNDVILATVLLTFFMNLLLFPYMYLVPVVARDVLGAGPGLMGLLMGALGLGALAGAVLIASTPDVRYHGRVYLGGSMLGLVGVLLFSFSAWYFVSLPLLVLVGLGTSGFGTMQSTIILLVARDEMRGRALGVVSLAIGAGPLGALMIGAIAGAVSTTFAIGLHAVLGMASVLVVGLLMPSLWRRIAAEERQPGAIQSADAPTNPTPQR